MKDELICERNPIGLELNELATFRCNSYSTWRVFCREQEVPSWKERIAVEAGGTLKWRQTDRPDLFGGVVALLGLREFASE